MRAYDAVLFDAGLTLVHPAPSFPDAIVEIVQERGIRLADGGGVSVEEATGAAFQRALPGIAGFSTSPEASRSFWVGVYADVLDRLGVPDPGGEVADHLYASFARPDRYTCYPDARGTLASLRTAGYRLGVVSNWEAWLGEVLDRTEISPFLEVLVVSGAIGIEKPDPRIFLAALERLSLEPERVLYVGDTPDADVHGPRAVGMDALLLDRRGVHDLRPQVRTLEEIPALLEAGRIGGP